MAKKMPKMIQKDNFGENPPPSGKIEKVRIPVSSATMTIRKGLSGEDLKKLRGK